MWKNGVESKCISVGKMKEILSKLKNDDLLFPNQVQNLSIHRGPDEEYIGFIDIGPEEVELFSDQ